MVKTTDEPKHNFHLPGKRVLVFLKSGFRFSGLVTDESESFLILEDDRTSRMRIFNKDELSNIEVLH